MLRWSKDNKSQTIISIAGRTIEKEDRIRQKKRSLL
jgi:hypothetical protein